MLDLYVIDGMPGEQKRMFGVHPADANRIGTMPPDLLESSSRPELFHTGNPRENDSPGRRRSLRYKSRVVPGRQSSTLLCSAHNFSPTISPPAPAPTNERSQGMPSGWKAHHYWASGRSSHIASGPAPRRRRVVSLPPYRSAAKRSDCERFGSFVNPPSASSPAEIPVTTLDRLSRSGGIRPNLDFHHPGNPSRSWSRISRTHSITIPASP